MKNGNEGMPVATVGEMRYGQNFIKKFLRSCETPIVITKNDTPEIAELKNAVIDAKIELKARYDAGEDISEIMNQTRRDLVELGAYRKEIDDMVRSMRREKGQKLTSEDYQDIVDAANIMLKNRGCARNEVFAAARIRKELMCGFLCAAGAMNSQYQGSMMSAIKEPKDLDKMLEDPPIDAIVRAIESLKVHGVTPQEVATYKKACEEGWAPAPTNEYQKAVWDKVHAPPRNPMKIKFDSKKGR
jgi:hypothetical protein